MLLRLLRLIPQFRTLEGVRDFLVASERGATARAAELEARDDSRIRRIAELTDELAEVRGALQQETQDRLVLQDRLNSAEEERQRLWDRLDVALAEERKSYQMAINQAWMREHGVAPHPEAPAPPKKQTIPQPDDTVIGRRPLPSEAIAARTRDFLLSQVKPGPQS